MIVYNVYILQSAVDDSKLYVGITNDLKRRLNEHNTEPTCSYTKAYKPWKIRTFINFDNKIKAEAFERYLKTPSGRAFLAKRLL